MDQPHSQNVYEGYLFFKADPLPGHRPTWYRVERSRIDFTQVELYRMIYTRAFKISAAKQYEALSTELRLQVNQLIHERRQQDRCVEWSCAYAEEHKGVAGGRDTISHGPDTIAMTVILICRPSATKTHRRTPMGDLVDLSMLRHHNEQDHYVRLTTASGSPAELQTLYHDIAMRNTHQNPIPPPTQEKASRICLERALFGHHSRTMNRSALLNG
ncbi:hypothetical protein VI817_007861 [Penicillium citrinum]|nr:hypothetical protein VI817_007861 [Penicillium citrinum]